MKYAVNMGSDAMTDSSFDSVFFVFITMSTAQQTAQTLLYAKLESIIRDKRELDLNMV
jgi:hypothetical protein